MKRNSVLIVISCLTGLVTASIYASRVQNLRDEIKKSSEKMPVLTVNRDIRAGESITTEDLGKKMLLKEQISRRTVLPVDIQLIVGRQTIHPIPAGDTVLWTDFPEGPRVQYPSEKIPPGYRMIALPADEIHTLTHFISPGDKVDIVSSTYDNSANQIVSRVIAEDIVVLGVGHQFEGKSNSSYEDDYPLSVSILVLQENALVILQASQIGETHFLAKGSKPLLKNYNQNNPAFLDVNFTREQP